MMSCLVLSCTAPRVLSLVSVSFRTYIPVCVNCNYLENQQVLKRVQLKKACLLAVIKNNNMGYFGHILRHNALQHVLLEGKIEGRHSLDRPRKMWMGT